MDRRDLLKAMASLPLAAAVPSFLLGKDKPGRLIEKTELHDVSLVKGKTPIATDFEIEHCVGPRIFYPPAENAEKLRKFLGPAVPVYEVVRINITTSFNLEQVFGLGQLSIYENLCEIPTVEVEVEVARYQENLLTTYNFETDTHITLEENGQQETRWETKEGFPIGNIVKPKDAPVSAPNRVYYGAHAVRIQQGDQDLLNLPCVGGPNLEGRFTIEVDVIGDNDSYNTCTIPMMKLNSMSWENLPEKMKYNGSNVPKV